MPRPDRETATAPSSFHPSFTPRSWDRLSPEERQNQIRELMDSPYWSLLPTQIRERFLELYRHS